jgi:hypothetical protein
MSELSQMPLRVPAEDHQWLKDFVALYPGDSLNAMMARFIRSRIEELCAIETLTTPPFHPTITSADIFKDGYYPERPRNYGEK